ncbi:TPA: hypothetical protein LA827_003170 [Clostridium botulinum]|nr:hypothetical protein [Clostridium botulinum]
MNLFIEIEPKYRKNSDVCIERISIIEKKIEKELLVNKDIKCAICGKYITEKFSIACRVYKESKKVFLHPVHIGCISENINVKELDSTNNNYNDISKNDLVDTIKLIETLQQIDVNEKQQNLKKSDTKCFTSCMPNPNIKGQPFYTMVEIKQGKLTGNIESFKLGNNLLPVLYVSKKIAEKAKEIKDSSFKNNYFVAGILKSQLNTMIEGFKGKFLVIINFEGNNAISAQLTSQELIELLKPNQWLSDIVHKMQ